MKGFSVITNFGCCQNCSYCIWKYHPLRNCPNHTNWNKLERALAFFTQDKISISGGGDPLYLFNSNIQWYERLFFLCEKYGKKIDIHTGDENFVLCAYSNLLKKCSRFIIHIDFRSFQIFQFLC